MHSVSMGSVCLALVLGLGACAGDDAKEKRLGDLEREVQKLRAANVALDDRIEALEERGHGGETTASDEERPEPAADDRPALAVVRLAPEPEVGAPEPPADVPVAPAAEDDGVRPVIRGDARGVERVDEPAGQKPAAGQKPGVGAKTPGRK